MKIPGLIAAVCLVSAGAAFSQIGEVPGLEVRGPYSSVKKNKDGTSEEFSRTPDLRTITKKTLSANKVLVLTTIYRLDANGNPKNCDIFDGSGKKLFKSRYGYSKKPGLTFGKLVEEQMFDARVPRYNPDTGEEMPVRRFIYTYDSNGKQHKPVALTLTPGRTYEEAYGPGPESSALQFDPFKGAKPPPTKEQANPNARPVGR